MGDHLKPRIGANTLQPPLGDPIELRRRLMTTKGPSLRFQPEKPRILKGGFIEIPRTKVSEQ